MTRQRHLLHIRIHDLAAYYEAGWTLRASSESIGYLVVEWKNARAPVVPFDRVAEVYAQWDRWRVRGGAVAVRRQSTPVLETPFVQGFISGEELGRATT